MRLRRLVDVPEISNTDSPPWFLVLGRCRFEVSWIKVGSVRPPTSMIVISPLWLIDSSLDDTSHWVPLELRGSVTGVDFSDTKET